MRAAYVLEQWIALGRSVPRLVRRTLLLGRHKLSVWFNPFPDSPDSIAHELRHTWRSHTNPSTQLTIILCEECGIDATDDNYKDACPRKQDS